MTTCEARYQVTCMQCGSVAFEPSRWEAKATANRHADKCDGGLAVFDRMARLGAVQVWALDWDLDGLPILKGAGRREAA